MIPPRSTKKMQTMTSTKSTTTMTRGESFGLLSGRSDPRRQRLTTNEGKNYINHTHHYNHHHRRQEQMKPSNKTHQTNSVVRRPASITTTKATLLESLSAIGFVVASTAALLLFTSTIVVEAIKLQPEGREKFYWSGEQFVITCQNTNNIKNVKIRWIGPNGLDITEDRAQRVHAESTGPHGHRLVVMNATSPDDDGQYKCTIGSADDRNPRERMEFNLKIHKQTSFKDTPRHLVLTAGQQGTLTCRVEFDPAALSTGVSWVRDQRPIEMFNDSTYTVLDYDSSRQLSQLIISPLTKQHDGVYTCRAMAETSRLSKISDFDIQLETNYAPTFDADQQTVWVERNRGAGGPSSSRVSAESAARQQQHANFYPNGVPRNSAHQPGVRNRHNRPGGGSSYVNKENSDASGANSSALSAANLNIVQVELRCTCQANPPASILWTSTQHSMYVLAKGEPAHVLEQPRTEVDGPNTTSILLIGYSLDQDWQYKRDSYICSASNKLGKASKTFVIEQGDPPPAFSVGQSRHYNPETSLFKFTLLGPIFDSTPTNEQQQSGGNNRSQPSSTSMHPQINGRHEIVPPVDAFRIRAEIPTSNEQSVPPSTSSSPSSGHQDPKSSYTRRLPNSSTNNNQHSHNHQQQAEPPSVTWNLDQQQKPTPNSMIGGAQNFTVNLGKLPSGNQRLFLEAHNAVGWSPDSTYLGEYYIVSGASSTSFAATFQMLPIVSALAASSVLMFALTTAAAPPRQ